MIYTKKLSYKARIFLYFLVIILFIVIAISTLLYFNVRSMMERETLNYSTNTVVQLKNSTETILDSIDHYLNQLAFDYDIQTFANSYDEMTYKQMQDVYDKVTNASSAGVYITSCFIYYFDSKKIIDSQNSMYIDVNQTNNREFFGKVLQLYRNEVPLKQYLLYMIRNPNNTNSLTVIKPVNIYSKQTVALLIVTIDPNYFSDLLNSIKIDEMVNVIITSADGDIIAGRNQQYNDFIRRLEREKRNLIESSKTGYFTAASSNLDCLVSYTTSERFNWKYFYVIPTVEIYKKIGFVKEFVILLSIACLVLGAFISFLLSINLYNPISNLVKVFRQNNESGVKNEGSDMEFIDNNVRNLISNNKGLMASLQESMPIMKNSFILRILLNDMDDEEPFSDKFKFYNLNILQDCYYGTAIFVIDQRHTLSSQYSEKQLGMLEVYQKELAFEAACREDGILAELAKTETNEMIMIFSIGAADRNEAREKMLNAVSKVHKELVLNMKFTLTAGVGSICEDIRKLRLSFKDACRALAYKVIRGNNTVIHIDEVPQISDWQYVYPYETEREIFNCLKQGDGDGILTALDKYFHYSHDHISELEDIKYAFIHLLDSTIRVLTEMSITATDIIHFEGNLYGHLRSKETVQDIYEWFVKLYMDIIAYIQEKKENKSDEIVSRITDYIENNFSNPDLSLDIISEELHFSSSYLGKLYRESSGKSIKELIIEKRVEKALKLLIQPSKKVKEVSEEVGYPNERSFINIFKKYIGETPGEYRDRYLKKLV